MRGAWLSIGVLAPIATCLADSGVDPDVTSDVAQRRPNSVQVFAGRLSTTDFGNTILYNLLYTPKLGKPSYDNDIVGVEYERDLLEVTHDVWLRAQGGLAERYGHYIVCCLTPAVGPHPDTTVQINGRVYSTEFWAGGKFRWENFHIGHGVKLEFAGAFGLSAVTRTIGRERQREIERQGNAHILGYLAPEVGMSLDRLPNFELVISVPHRSGAWGTFGHMEEGYNADVIGVRYYF